MWSNDDLPPPDLNFSDFQLRALARSVVRFQAAANATHPLSAHLARVFLRALSEEEAKRAKNGATNQFAELSSPMEPVALFGEKR